MGLIPRAMHMLWAAAQAQQVHGWSYTFEAQMVEVYLDQIADLLGDHARCDVVHMGHHSHVEPAEIVPLARPDDVYQLLARAKKRRQVAATKMNERSSRSHSVFALRVRGTQSGGETSDATLHLVDLAGSERLATSGSAADPQRLREAQSINKSLSSLADVMAALATHAKHVPYRNSTLTWLLKPCLSQGAKTYVLNYSLQAHASGPLAAAGAPGRDTVFAALRDASARHASRPRAHLTAAHFVVMHSVPRASTFAQQSSRRPCGCSPRSGAPGSTRSTRASVGCSPRRAAGRPGSRAAEY